MSPTTPSDVENASTSSHTHAAKPEEKDDHREKKTEVLEDATLAFPDGGPQAWLNVLGGWLIMFAASGYINSFGVYQDYYTRVFMTNKTPSEISWIGSFQLFLIFGMALFAGALFDKGYFHHLLISGTTILVFSQFMVSLTKPEHYYQTFLSQGNTGLGAGIGMGLLFLPGLAMLPHWFRRRRALALGIAVSGGSVGGMLTPIMLNQLFNRPSVGFAWGVRAEAFVTLGLLIVVNLIMKPRLPSGKKAREAAKKKQLDIKAIFKDGPYWLACIGLFLIGWGIYFPVFYIQLFSIEHRLSSNFAFYTLTILNGASILGRTLPNFIADDYGALNLIIPTTIMSAIMILVLLACGNVGGVVAFAVVYGISSGAYLSLVPAVITSLARSMEELGIRAGVALFVIAFAQLTGTPIAGALLGPEYHWWKPIVFTSVVVFAGAVVLLWTRIYMVERKGSRYV